MADAVEARELAPGDSERALRLRNAIFPSIDHEHWAQNQTAAVAYLGQTLVGVIPFTIREFVIAPEVSIQVATANSVGVADGHRGAGIGSRMMDAAREFLPRWADATFVYTATEAGGPQYRFYRRCGYQDLLYPRRMRRTVGRQPPSTDPGCAMRSLDAALGMQDDLLRVYQACFAGYGGVPPRAPGYWTTAFESQIFVALAYEEFAMAAVSGASRLEAYALAGLRRGDAVVLEWAAIDEPAADRLWGMVERLARRWGTRETVVYAQELTGPFPAALTRAAFSSDPRDDVLCGQVLRPQDVFAGRWPDRPAPTVAIWTPRRELRLGPGRPEVVLEMKEATLHRLLLARVDLSALVRRQYVTVRVGDLDAVNTISRALAPAPWAYHHLDYL
jgi:GNAT superfamily N-acetyltransferase